MFKCTQCNFTTQAKTPSGLIQAMRRHRKQKPSHKWLMRIYERKPARICVGRRRS